MKNNTSTKTRNNEHHHHHGIGHHQHHHGAGGHSHGDNREGNKKGLLIAFVITTSIMVLEFAGGLVTGSLALLSDSGHMLSDASSLLLSLVAMIFAAKAASPKRTFGFYRFEILAALFNGVTLFVIAFFIIKEACERFYNPPEVASGSMMLIASIGLAANMISAWMLMRKGDVKNNVNLRSAYLHVLGDMLGSVGAIVAGLVMLVFGWYVADPIISVVVALLILRGAWGVLKQAVHILMEGTPDNIDHDEVKQTLQSIDGVVDVHDLHIWTVTSGFHALSCHMRVDNDADSQAVLQQAIHRLETEYGITHSTIQTEHSHIQHEQLKL
ncbi:Cadmium, cobalt and zinc/H(+)-K(+) antiporter [Paenibacillus sp. CECT 9249]|uniref:cation diffusion facilitator family transporter n=1 Tax=Paenibacillus sp. CECT 9249 TaxID=2845385 RepID=UPI001E5277F7|nr:cation diffusion facilitator family transporter [Paenibacillus sp. CECT 9249]CAH0119504.1 Cadmium, cobalt and zinc/H(+)-K(+) antiporter [Paenibacillus sp. CECT 9249]